MLKTRPIKEFPNYRVSRSGIVITPSGQRLSHNWRGFSGGAYLYVTFPGPNSKRIKRQSHILVAIAWKKNPDPKA